MLRKPSHQKLECGKSKSDANIQDYVDTVDSCCMLLAMKKHELMVKVFTVYVDTVNNAIRMYILIWQSMNYSKIWFKALICFEWQLSLTRTLRIKSTSNPRYQLNVLCIYWNFKLTMFELTMHFTHEMTHILAHTFHTHFELSGTSN